MSMRWNSHLKVRNKNANSPYGANFGGLWLARKLAYKNPAKDLTSEGNWYLPFK